jgi:hypothetical protein
MENGDIALHHHLTPLFHFFVPRTYAGAAPVWPPG